MNERPEPKLSPRYCEACKAIRPIAPCDDPDNCPMDPHGNRPGPKPDFNPYELWNLQEKPHVSDNALNMGPIPGTEGIESDPPESPLHATADAVTRMSSRESWPKWVREIVEPLEAQRDALKADIAEIQRKLTKAMRQRNEFRAALYDARTNHRAETAALKASKVSRETLAEIKAERDNWQHIAEKHKNKYEEAQKEIKKLKHKNHALQHNKHGT